MLRAILVVGAVLISTAWVGCGGEEDTEKLHKRAMAGDAGAMLKFADVMLAEGKPWVASRVLMAAAYQGNKEALKRLEQAARWNSGEALSALCEYYSQRGENARAQEYYYKAALVNPKRHAFMLASFLLFPEHGATVSPSSEDRERGVELLNLAGEHGDGNAYLLLQDLCEQGVIKPESEAQAARWREGARKATDLDVRVLARLLKTFNSEAVKPYAERWQARARDLPRPQERGTQSRPGAH